MATIALNCLVSGDGADKIFTIKIAPNKSISILKDIVKGKQHIVFSNTQATDIRLFKVSLSVADLGLVRDPRKIDHAQELLEPLAKISAIFKDPLPDDRVHVIALAPPATIAMAPSTPRNFACYYPAETPVFFKAKVDPDDDIEDLLSAIWQRLKDKGEDVLLKELSLYKTDIRLEPSQDRADRARQFLSEHCAEALDPAKKVAKIFPHDSHRDGQLDILVANPKVLELGDNIGNPAAQTGRKIRKDLDGRIAELPSKLSPSDTVKRPQELRAFLDQRVYRNQVPVALFNVELATLQTRLDSNDLEVSAPEVNQALAYIDQSLEYYEDEKARQRATFGTIDSALGAKGHWGETLPWANGIRPDGCWYAGDFVSIILVLKNMPGVGGDPIYQSIVDLSKILACSKYDNVRGSCNFPVVLIGIADARLQVSIAVCIGSIYVSDLIYIDLSRGFHGSDTAVRLARIFKALSLCLQALEGHYNRIVPSTPSDTSFMYPSPTTANGTPLPVIKYTGYLGHDGLLFVTVPNLGERNTAIYTGTQEDKPVLIKFAPRYNKEAHTLLANANLAPSLRFFEPIIGNLFMVVMDYYPDAKSVWMLRNEGGSDSLLPIIANRVKCALSLLHNQDIVFGDLRDGNIIYVEPCSGDTPGAGCVMLVDFDWCGLHGVARYSATLNELADWAPGVWPYEVMRKEHDLWQLEQLVKLCSSNDT
ncbi:hypothetical protein FA15DRAFT_641962 [Coprinopsis marcescibilis]|uniref:Protein kinase domain-containing protein n=1 Tax=Coprinopsis marcescibilis TaxID=230819 RepID=A0A5C3L6K5_COPMA|nr:hypothetical protein FA15DRAFT_641962 [Coprinopsis marcescibilis]